MAHYTLPRVLDALQMIDEDTVEIRYKEAVHVSLDDMRELLTELYAFTDKKRLKRLVVITKNSTLELQARLLLQQENKDNSELIIAEAVLVTSLTQKMTTNFYLKFIKDIYPSRFFTDYNKAIEWLKHFSNN